MSWKLGFIVIGERRPAAEMLAALGVTAAGAPRAMSPAEALEPVVEGATAVLSAAGFTLVLDRRRPYDLAYAPPFDGPLDRRLKELSKTAPVLAGFLDGTSASAAFCVFEDGAAIRARKVVSGRPAEDHGAPLAEEKSAADEESRLFAVTARWLGAPLDDLFFEPDPEAEVYETRPERRRPKKSLTGR